MSRARGKYEQLAIERHERDMALFLRKSGHPKGFRFDEQAADRPVQFLAQFCRHHEGEWAGLPLMLGDWQRNDVVRPLFGWLRQDGTRRFRKAWIEIPRKNGKTILGSGLALYMLVADNEAGAQIYSTATKKEQAKILWDGAAKMVRASPDLKRFLKIHKSAGGTIFCDRLGAKMLPLSSDAETQDGLNPHGDFRDEVHEWTDHDLCAVLDTAVGARRQPLTLEITTAGVYDPNGVGWRHHEYATQVLDGAFEDDRQFAYIAAIDDGDDPFDPETWAKANPNLGVSVKASFLADEAVTARRSSDKTNDFLRYHCNRWVQQVTRWLSVERWKECDPVDDPLAVREARELALVGRLCVGGLDLASRLDLAAFVMVFPADDGSVDLLCRFWLPEDTIRAQAAKGRKHYEQWAAAGWITSTPGSVIDYKFIRADIKKLRETYTALNEIAYDNWNAQSIATDLGEDDGFTMVEMRQGFQSLSEPSKEFESKIVEGKVRHGGNPVMAWMIGNAVIRKDPAGNIKPDKEKAKDKIDGVVASIMALSRSMAMPDEAIYTGERGLLTL